MDQIRIFYLIAVRFKDFLPGHALVFAGDFAQRIAGLDGVKTSLPAATSRFKTTSPDRMSGSRRLYSSHNCCLTVSSTGYFGIILLMFLENVFPPIPSEVIMPLAGFMAVEGKQNLLGTIIAGTVGSVLGALPLYYAGLLLGEDRLNAFAEKHGRWLTISRDDLDRAKKWFDQHGRLAVLLCRLVPGVRSLISIPAGIAKMNIVSFLVYSAIGAGLWTALLAAAGYILGAKFEKVGEYLNPVSYVVLGAILLIYFTRVFKGSRRKRDA